MSWLSRKLCALFARLGRPNLNVCALAKGLLGANKSPVYPVTASCREGETRIEVAYSAAYAVCALIAFLASRARANSATVETAPFWLRIAIVCTVFAILRFAGAQLAVNDAFTDFSRSSGLTDWERPGPYIMIAAILAFGAAAAGLFVFRLRSLHRSVLWAGLAIVLLVLLALAHSLSLYWPNVILQTGVGPLTVSRLMEALLLLILTLSAIWFIRDAQGGAPAREI